MQNDLNILVNNKNIKKNKYNLKEKDKSNFKEKIDELENEIEEEKKNSKLHADDLALLKFKNYINL